MSLADLLGDGVFAIVAQFTSAQNAVASPLGAQARIEHPILIGHSTFNRELTGISLCALINDALNYAHVAKMHHAACREWINCNETGTYSFYTSASLAELINEIKRRSEIPEKEKGFSDYRFRHFKDDPEKRARHILDVIPHSQDFLMLCRNILTPPEHVTIKGISSYFDADAVSKIEQWEKAFAKHHPERFLARKYAADNTL